jgi:hypothetical protein
VILVLTVAYDYCVLGPLDVEDIFRYWHKAKYIV